MNCPLAGTPGWWNWTPAPVVTAMGGWWAMWWGGCAELELDEAIPPCDDVIILLAPVDLFTKLSWLWLLYASVCVCVCVRERERALSDCNLDQNINRNFWLAAQLPQHYTVDYHVDITFNHSWPWRWLISPDLIYNIPSIALAINKQSPTTTIEFNIHNVIIICIHTSTHKLTHNKQFSLLFFWEILSQANSYLRSQSPCQA